jgi:hypothetical protein
MTLKGLSFWFAFFLLFVGGLRAGNDLIKIQSQSATSLTLQANFPEPQKIINQINNDSRIHFEMSGMQLRQQDSYPVTPFLTKLFSLQGKNVSYRIKKVEKKSIQLNSGEKFSVVQNQNRDGSISKSELLEIKYQGLFRDIPIYTITFFPIQYDPASHSVTYITDLQIEISTNNYQKSNSSIAGISRKDSELSSKILLNSNIALAKQPYTINAANLNAQKYKENRYKIAIDKTGLYQITYSDLVEYGITPEQFDTKRLKISSRGLELPIYFKGGEDGRFDPGDYFEFWGEVNRSPLTARYEDVYNDPFSDINIYWMEIGESTGLRMAEESGALAESNKQNVIKPYAFTEKIHFEEDNSFLHFGHESANIDSLSYAMDHWFFDRGIIAVSSRTYPVELIWPSTEVNSRSVFVKTMMRGLSQRSLSNPLDNHKAEIWLNDAKVGESGEWKDQNLHVITNYGQLGLPQSAIKHGENQFRVIMDQTGVTDQALLNWFEIEYLRKYRAEKNFIRFKKQKNLPDGYVLQFEVDGFTDPEIDLYKLGISKMMNNRIDFVTTTDRVSSYRITFQDEIFYPDIEYVAIAPSAKKKPISIIKDLPWKQEIPFSSLYDNGNQAEYLIITDKLYYENVKNLKTYRERDGLAVEIVLAEDIYDEFNYGIKSPLAIKNFLKYTFNQWDTSRRLMYVVLIGSASYDYKEKRSGKQDQVPTFLFETLKYGAAASDYPYGLVSGNDDIPDLIVSRIPVTSNSEFNNYMEKIEGYESPENTGEWRTKGLFISGNDGSTKEIFTGQPAFRIQNQRLINLQMPDGFFARKLNTIEDTTIVDKNFGGTNDLIDYFDDGLSVVNFFGHGGGGIWADVQLMNTGDVDRLSEHFRLPFIQSMTCFTGAFESGSINGLSDNLLLASKKGAIGVLAASGVGWLYNDFALSWNISDYLFDHDLNIGEAVLYGKMLYLHDNSYITEARDESVPSYSALRKSMVNHYNLFGDPYIKLQLPDNNLTITLDNYLPAAGDTIKTTVQAPFSSGSGRIELTNESHENLSEYYFNLQNGTAVLDVAIPNDLADQVLYIEGYASDDFQQSESRGDVKFAINKALVDSVVTSPKFPEIYEFINFSIYLKSPDPLSQVKIKNIRSGNGGNDNLEFHHITDSLWVYDQGFGPYTSSDTVYYDIELVDSSGIKYLSRRHRLAITDPRPDIKIIPNTLKFIGVNQIELTANLYNNSDVSLSDVNFAVFLDSYSKNQTAYYSSKFNFEPFEKLAVNIPVNLDQAQSGRQFFAVLDGQAMIEESDEINNILSAIFPDNLNFYSNEIGTTNNGITNDTISMGSVARINLAAHSLTASSVFFHDYIDVTTDLVLDTQPGFHYIKFPGATDTSKLSIQMQNPDADFIKSGYLEFKVDTNLYSISEISEFKICRYYRDIGRWVKLETDYKADKIFTQVSDDGEYAIFHISDTQKPVIEITVNGRNLTEGMFVPKNPKLAFILQDENGIDLKRGFSLSVDNDSIPKEDIILPDSLPNANAVSILSTPNVAAGEHTLKVQVKDVNGNETIENYTFVVASEFELRVFGNYPNPFEDNTIISFEIIADGLLEQFSVKLYTVSGRKIREIYKNEEYPDEVWSPGYHEIEWDGLDEDRNLVANGVYFAVVIAKYKGKTVEHTLKLAKLK